MKLKLDENLGRRGFEAFARAGHDVSSVHLQQMDGATDREVFEVCRTEGRVVVTLDLDFSNPLVFDPRPTAGVAVIRLSRHPTPSELAVATERLIEAFREIPIDGLLWVVHHDRIRVWSPGDEDDT